MTKKQILIGIGAVILLGIMIFASPSVFVRAQSPFTYGGINLFTFPCTCSANFLLTIGPPQGGQFIYQPGISMVYKYFMVLVPGAWHLGLYTPGGVCMVYAGKGCVSYGAPRGTITMVGTSL